MKRKLLLLLGGVLLAAQTAFADTETVDGTRIDLHGFKRQGGDFSIMSI